jgi:hypothetical protein
MCPQTRNLGAVKLSLDFLSTRSIGELNIAFRSMLDAFSYRLDAWIAARANRRLEQMRAANPTGLYIGGYAWVQNLKADDRPDSEGFLLAPSQGQAATAALLRSGFMANHEQGAFDIALDSRRTRRASDILQGLTRDQPLAALYGYRIERGLRDALLGKFIWPLRLAYPWRPVGGGLPSDATEAIGARDVVDGVAVLADWESGPVRLRQASRRPGPWIRRRRPCRPANSRRSRPSSRTRRLADSATCCRRGRRIVRQPRARGGGDGGGRQADAADRKPGRTHAAWRRKLYAAHCRRFGSCRRLAG